MDSSQVPLYIFYGVVALFALGTILSGFFQVMTAEAVVIQRATVGLAAGWIDVDATHLAAGDVNIAGPFLDGFEITAARPAGYDRPWARST